jgi:hypothetical protein
MEGILVLGPVEQDVEHVVPGLDLDPGTTPGVSHACHHSKPSPMNAVLVVLNI